MSLPYQGFHIATPPAIISITQGSATGELTGSYQYVVTFVSIYGETLPSPATSAVTITGSASLTGIPTGPIGVNSRNIYRTIASGTEFLLLTTITNNTVTTYTDSTADTSLGDASPPVISLADSIQTMEGYYQFTKPSMRTFNLNVSPGSTSPGPVISTEYTTITGTTAGYVSLPPLNENLVGLELKIANINTSACIIVPASNNTIGGASTYLLIAEGGYIIIIATSADNWDLWLIAST